MHAVRTFYDQTNPFSLPYFALPAVLSPTHVEGKAEPIGIGIEFVTARLL